MNVRKRGLAMRSLSRRSGARCAAALATLTACSASPTLVPGRSLDAGLPTRDATVPWVDSAPRDANIEGSTGADAETGPPFTARDGCPLNSGYGGDSMCLTRPAAGQGFQLHYGPTDYAAPANVSPYVLQPGQETDDCYYLKTPNSTDVYVGGYQFSMRPGSHEVNVNVNPTAQADGFVACGGTDTAPGLLLGSVTPRIDELTGPAPENQGLAIKLPANSQAVINLHGIDTTSQPTLREAWLNYMYIDPSQVRGMRGNLFLVGGLGFQITPGAHQTYTYSCAPSRPVRVLSMAADVHAHTIRTSAWKVTGGTTTSLVYEAYDWATPTLLHYDSVHQNPTANPATQTAGGPSGPLTLQPGESLRWECEVNNTSNVTLTFGNELYTGEVCVMTGTLVPTDNPMSAYDFTCTMN
jgi:hypothetical protein